MIFSYATLLMRLFLNPVGESPLLTLQNQVRESGTMTLQVGFIGTGGIANKHISNMQHIDGIQIAAFCDLVLEKAEELARQWPGANAYDNATHMLDTVKLDAVYVCVPPMAHGEIEELLIERGIPFLVEKPVGSSMEVPLKILQKIRNKGLMVAVGYHWRQTDSVQRAKELLEEHRAGMVLGYWLGGMPKTPWWRNMALSGGQFVEQTTHIADTLRYLCGEVTEVHAHYGQVVMHEKMDNSTVPDVGVVSLKLANGGVAMLANTCMLTSGNRNGLEIYTHSGVLDINQKRLLFTQGKDQVEETLSQEEPFLKEDRLFIEAVRTGDPSLIKSDYADACKTLQIAVAANESAAAGKPVAITDIF
jgi:myo-inositol 2-dehydrogenase/D-chiro-inositol 1-dehydrogenase